MRNFTDMEGCCWGRGYRDKLSFSAGRAQSRVYLQDQLRAEKENELVDLNGTSHEMGPQRKDTIPQQQENGSKEACIGFIASLETPL